VTDRQKQNELIAVKVLGWKKNRDGWWHDAEGPTAWRCEEDGDYYRCQQHCEEWEPYSDLRCTWELIFWLKKWHTVLIEVGDKTKVMAGEWTKHEGFWPNYEAEGSFCDAACEVALQWAARLEEINKPDEESA
jgi:hypothetical protein